jgi:NADP-dependent 3-hydroxy acid dehydrogenase YdfG
VHIYSSLRDGYLCQGQNSDRHWGGLRYVYPQDRLLYQVLLITWSPGICLAFAKLLLENGCNVLIGDLALRPEALVVVDKYTTKSNDSARAVFQKTDVTDWLQLDKMFTVAEQEFGEIDIVCPGAGVFEPVRLALTIFCSVSSI